MVSVARLHLRHREDEEDRPEQEDLVAAGELSEVLHELHADSAFGDAREKDPLDDHVTVEAIAEAADVSEDEVITALSRVRREDERARVARVIRELEEPTHRVERPGHASTDPVVNHPSLKRGLRFSDILDHLPRPGVKKRRMQKMTKEERIAAFVSYVILLAVTSAVVVLLVRLLQN
ncbi:MAG: hypothetical protein IH945_08620 [Armatimonadetes bacterium]|nr:hypothetical protein [Armatimonadota bacterium]